MYLVSPKHLFAACALIVCSAVAGYADRFGDFTYVEYDTTIEITDYPRAATGDVIIPSEIVGKPVTRIGESAFHLCTSLTSVAIPDSVTSIGTEAFEWCTSLTSVTIPDGVTNIGEGPFLACHSLTSVTVPESVITIGRHAFKHCSRMAILYFEGNAPNLTGSTFDFSDNLEVFFLAGTTGWGATYGGRSTRLTTGTLDPLIGGLDLAEFESWFVSEWFGPYSTTVAPWVYHAEHGFLYRNPESTGASTYFYDDAMGAWWWTNTDIYPAVYAFDPPADNAGTDINSAWLWCEKGTKAPRSFIVLTGDLAGATLYYDS